MLPLLLAATQALLCGSLRAAGASTPIWPQPPPVHSSWDDLTSGISTLSQWKQHREVLKQRFLELLRDEQKPSTRPPLGLTEHESILVDGIYKRMLVSYNVETNERAWAYIGVPVGLKGKAPGIVALHGTNEESSKQTAGLGKDTSKAFLDHLCRRGYVVIAPEHFVAGHRTPPEGPYDTTRFYQKHPQWTAVGKFTYKHSIAIDVLRSLPEVDSDRIGALGHSLGGQGAFFLAAYDERIKAAAANCSASAFRDNPAVEQWARDRWYVYFKNIRPGLLEGKLPPIDLHEIIALIAPRPYLDISALNEGNPGVQRQRVLFLMKIMEVYNFYHEPQNFSFYVHGYGHAVPLPSRELMYGWMDAHLKTGNSGR